MEGLDDPSRIFDIQITINRKRSLRKFYEAAYLRYKRCLSSCPAHGLAIELGSGGGFVKKIIPELIVSDVLPYTGMDVVIDGTRLPFPNNSLKFIGMINVFHHIPDVEKMLAEVQRCLSPGGKMLIIDQHPGYISKPILKNIHHEPFVPEAKEWKFESGGPLSDANGALAWIVFRRDLVKFVNLFSRLRIVSYIPHSPLEYWMTGGLKSWNLIPGWGTPLVRMVDRILLSISRNFASFVDIEVVKEN